jgi:sialate O-acetylesterase
MVSAAPYMREAQLKAHLAHRETGFVVACDLGHIQMHSPFKTPLGERLARWALATQYNRPVTFRTPLYRSMTIQGRDVVVQFDVDVHPIHGGRAKIKGFAVAGKDRHFYPAEARLDQSNTVKLSSEFVPRPVAVRYAWATHPFGTLVGAGSSGLPAAPFRTDAWPWKDAPFAKRGSTEDTAHRRWQADLRDQATAWAQKRLKQEAQRVLEQE